MKLEGVEPPTFGSGIRRATNCAIASEYYNRSLSFKDTTEITVRT